MFLEQNYDLVCVHPAGIVSRQLPMTLVVPAAAAAASR